MRMRGSHTTGIRIKLRTEPWCVEQVLPVSNVRYQLSTFSGFRSVQRCSLHKLNVTMVTPSGQTAKRRSQRGVLLSSAMPACTSPNGRLTDMSICRLIANEPEASEANCDNRLEAGAHRLGPGYN